MNKPVFKVFLIVTTLLLLSSCVKDIGTNIIATEKNYEEFSTGIIGLSGLCFSKDSSSLMAVSDKNGIYELNFDGTTKRKLDYNGGNDFEAITYNYKTGVYILADETDMTVSVLNNDFTLLQITKVIVEGGISNKGIEGIAYGEDTLYIVNQEEPTVLIKYDLKSNTEKLRKIVTFAINGYNPTFQKNIFGGTQTYEQLGTLALGYNNIVTNTFTASGEFAYRFQNQF